MKRGAVSYCRVSTVEQGHSGLGLEAQRRSVSDYVASTGMELVAEYSEVESGKHDDRPELHRAIAHAKRTKSLLVIAKLDRLSRNVSFIASLMDSGVRFVAADNPSANELTVHILAAVAQAERKAIGERTKAALAAARARGRTLGNPKITTLRPAAAAAVSTRVVTFKANVLPLIETLRAAGCTTFQAIADSLNARGIKTARSGRWTATTVRRVLRGEERAVERARPSGTHDSKCI
jgi:DNA invertase Pin-like site-specific DNA recombinase